MKGAGIDYLEKCPECGSRNLLVDSHRAELRCDDCQLVIADELISDQRPVGLDEPQQQGEDRILPQLHFGGRDSSGRGINPAIIWTLRLTAQKYNLKSAERGILSMEARIRRHAAQLRVPAGIVQRAIAIFREAKREQIFKKPSLNEWALANLQTACREARYIVPWEDLMQGSTDKISKVKEYHYEICTRLGINYEPFTFTHYIVYLAGKLGISDTAVINRAVGNAVLNPNENGNPLCVSGAALYMSLQDLGIRVSQKEFCRDANISEISLRHWVQKLGGYKKVIADIPEPDSSGSGEDLVDSSRPEGDNEDENREEDARNRRNNPAPPEQPERHDDRTYKRHALCYGGDAFKKVRHKRKVVAYPRRDRKRGHPRPKAHKQGSNR